MSVTITCYGAANEIGGNKLLLEDDSSRIMLDFGIAFGRQAMYFNEFLRPRAARGLLDSLLLELIPPLEGIYRSDLVVAGAWERAHRSPYYRRLDGLAGVLLSHAHLDHNGDESYLDTGIPIVCSRQSAFISRAMQVTGLATMETERVLANPRLPGDEGELKSDRFSPHILRPHAFLDGALRPEATTFWLEEGASRNKPIQPAAALPFDGSIAGMEVRWWPVDHSIPGAVGYAIHTSAGWVAYTGDIRFHGRQRAATQRFAEALADLHPIALICEGTHPELDMASPTVGEDEIITNALPVLHRYEGKLVIADFAPRNIERLLSFCELAQQTGRILLAQPKDIYLMRAMCLADPDSCPAPEALPTIAMYADPKAAPRPWEQELRAAWSARQVTPNMVTAQPGLYLLAFSLWDLNDLVDLENTRGGVYLYSNSKAYDDEQAVDLARLRNWVAWAGLDLVGDPDDPQRVRLHASGHANGQQLAEFVRTVSPQQLIPIHTEDPTWWRQALRGAPTAIRPPSYAVPLSI